MPLAFTVELPYTTKGITFTDNGDGGIHIKGTSTDAASINYKGVELIKGLTYRLVHINNTSGINTFISYKDENGTSQLYATKTNANFIFSEDYTFSRAFLQVDKGKTVDVVIYPMLVLGGVDRTQFEPYVEPTTYTVNADGTVEDIKSIYPTTILYTDTSGAVIDVEYNKDTNKAFAELQNVLISLGGNI